MKKLHLCTVSLFFVVCSFAQESDLARLIFYREQSMQGAALSFNVYANDTLVGKLRNKSYFVYNCPPGEYTLAIQNTKNSNLTLIAEAGKTYYCRFLLNVGMNYHF